MTDTVQSLTNAIDITFPVAGQDNNSQGFRDNFTHIQSALSLTSTELITLTANSATLVGPNNFNRNEITNAITYKLYGKVIAGTTNIDVSAAEYQTFTITSATTLTFTNWPTFNGYAKIRLQLKSDGTQRLVTFATENGHTIKYDTLTSYPLAIPANSAHYVFVDAWIAEASVSGFNVFVKYVGEFG
jgi:hypothetical protein